MRREQPGARSPRDKLLRLLLLGGVCWGVISAGSCVMHREEPIELDTVDLLPGVAVIPRNQWNAAPLKGTPERMPSPYRITLHHIGEQVVADFDRASSANLIRSIQQYHQGERGWLDIGYHYIVDRGGRIWEGRPLCLVGAHAGSSGANKGNIGVLLLGNFNRQVPSGSQMRSLEGLLDALCHYRRIHRRSVAGHNEVRKKAGLGPTECPGTFFSTWLQEYRRT